MGLLLLLLTYSASAAPSVSATAVSATAVITSAVSASAVKAPAVKAPAVRALTINTSAVDGNTSSQANTRLAIIAGTVIAAVVVVIIFYVIARRCGATNEQIFESCGKPFFKLAMACSELLQKDE